MVKLTEILHRVSSTPYAAFFYSPLKSGNEECYFFSKPDKIHLLKEIEDADAFLSMLDANRKDEGFMYTILPYELGFLFEQRLRNKLNEKDVQSIRQNSLIVSFSKRDVQRIKTTDIDFTGFTKDDFSISNFKLNASKQSFCKNVERIKNFIAEGDTYQVNLTAPAYFQFKGSVESFYSSLLHKQSADYSAFINLPTKILLSLSPELFFELNGETVTAKPMKGTARRGKNSEDDLDNQQKLFLSDKNRAENLMIVDLLRNDLGKISKQNSVTVKKLFEIEKYESLFQMISTVKGSLKSGVQLSELIKNIFPCGSITGAPKIRTMEIIHQLENTSRGIYTGSIGLLLPEKSIFNIAIRTVEIDKSSLNGKIGIGAGITWGSDAREEYSEVLDKGAFVTKPFSEFSIFTSLLFENRKPFLFKEHIKRLKKSAEYFLYYFDEKKLAHELENCFASLNEKKKYKIRIALNKFGKISITKKELTKNQLSAFKVAVSNEKIDPSDTFRYFKTTNRELYDSELTQYHAAGFDEILFLNKQKLVIEGSISNIFIFQSGKWRTPPVASGLLNGIYRRYFIKKHDVVEENLRLEDIRKAEKIILTNAVRKIIPVCEIILKGETIYKSSELEK